MTWPTLEMIQGWRSFVEASGVRWQFEFQRPHDKMLHQLEQNPPDGVIAYLGTEFYADWISQQPFPAVNHSSALPTSPIPRVCVDDLQAGIVAAEHFIGYGHRYLAYIGHEAPWFSHRRWQGVCTAAQQEGLEVEACWIREPLTPASRQRNARSDQKILKFLRSLPEPCGVFVCNDPLGLRVLELAQEAGRSVPDSIAVLGMDNDPLGQLAFPPLSSVVPPLERIAYQSAHLLYTLMQGEPALEHEHLLAPVRVDTRQSTDAVAVQDQALAKALKYLRAHFREGVTVEDLARAGGVNRRTLEHRFRTYLNRSPSREIKRMRIEHAKMLLLQSDLNLEQISLASGFQDVPWFMTVFRKETGMTPRTFRMPRNT